MRIRIQHVMSVLFIGLMAVGLLAQISRLDFVAEPNENRNKSEFPRFEWSKDCLMGCGAGLEKWFNDRFAMRNSLLYLNSVIRNLGLKSPTSNKVYFGKDGWLFPSENASRENARHANPFSGAELKRLTELLEARKKWMERRKIKYLMMVVPNSETIYPEFLPEHVRARRSPLSRLDQFVAIAKEIGFPLLDLRDEMKGQKEKSKYYFYQKTDTHWTELGAFYAYQALMRAIGGLKNASFAAPLPLNRFEVSLVKRQGPGDMALMLGLASHYTEEVPILHSDFLKSQYKVLTDESSPGFITESLVGLSHGSPKAMFFRDSFFILLQPFLSPHFKHARFIPLSMGTKWINEHKPELIVEEIAERRLTVEFLQPSAIAMEIDNFQDE